MFRKTIFAALAACCLPALAAAQPLGGFGQGTPSNVALGAWSMTYGASNSTTAATTSGALFTAGTWQVFVKYCTIPSSTGNVWLNPTGAAAVADKGLVIPAGGAPNGCICFGAGSGCYPFPTATVTAISDSGTATLFYAGY